MAVDESWSGEMIGRCDHRSGMPLALPMQRMLRRYAGDCGYSRAL
jgi:hypothetical protein